MSPVTATPKDVYVCRECGTIGDDSERCPECGAKEPEPARMTPCLVPNCQDPEHNEKEAAHLKFQKPPQGAEL
jgi:hypothetical protein